MTLAKTQQTIATQRYHTNCSNNYGGSLSDASKEETTSADVAIQAFAKISLTPTPCSLPMPTAWGPDMKEGASVKSRLPRRHPMPPHVPRASSLHAQPHDNTPELHHGTSLSKGKEHGGEERARDSRSPSHLACQCPLPLPSSPTIEAQACGHARGRASLAPPLTLD